MRKFFSVIALLCCVPAMAQQQSELTFDKTVGTPYRPRIAEFTISNLYDYHTYSQSEVMGNSITEVERDQKIKARLGIPFIMKDDLLVGFQLKYDRQNFLIDFEDNIPHELYEYIEKTKFTGLGGRFLMQKKLSNDRELTVIAGAELNSDQITWNKYSSKYFASVNYKVKKNEDVEIGGGLALAYTLGVPQVYPILYYENHFAPKWTLDLALPKSAILRLEASSKCFVSFKAEVKGWRYAVHNDQFSDSELLTLRKADVRLGVNFEHEIHDWLWLGADAGISKNVRHYLVEAGHHYKDAVVDLKATSAPYFNISLFIVPPMSIYKHH